MSTDQPIKKVWIDDYLIHSYEVDVKGNATLPVLCQFMQESAWHHAENLRVGFTHLTKRKLIWVLGNFYIKVHKYPKWGESIKVHTWPSGKGRLSYYRDFKIVNQRSEIIGAATTKWFAIDLMTRKPADIDSLFNYNLENSEAILPHNFDKLSELQSRQLIKSFQVDYFDLDVNEHVNNVKYIEWILENFPLDFQKSHNLTEIQIYYLTEALYQQQLTLYQENSENMSFYHSLMRNSDNVELCRAKTKWQTIEVKK